MANNPTEYANTINDKYSTTNYSGINGPARYKCNNNLGTNDIPITVAKDTYGKLYEIYNKYDKNTNVIPKMFDYHDADYCMIGDGTNNGSTVTDNETGMACPHNRNNKDSNILAYTENTPTVREVLVKDLKFYLDDCGARIRDYDKQHSNDATNPASYKPIKDYAAQFRDGSYNMLVSTRSDLDNKMNEILGNNKNSILYEKQGELDATVYSTLLWTVMVTSLLYYVFTKI